MNTLHFHPAPHDRPVHTDTRNLRLVPPQGQQTPLPSALLRTPTDRSRYAHLVRDLKSRYKISIKKWRSSMSGVAYELTYADGTIKRLISAPKPKSPVSAAIFLHEVGHHAVGFRRYKDRALEEFYVWQWTLREMSARHIPVTPNVLRHYKRSMHHYVKRAHTQNHPLPHDLLPFLPWPG